MVKGVLYLGLYYAAAAVLAGIGAVSSHQASEWVMALLTPVQAFDPDVKGLAFPAATYVGLALQTGLVAVVLLAISSRLQRPALVAAAG